VISSRPKDQSPRMAIHIPPRTCPGHLHLAALYEILKLDEGPAAQIQADRRGDWADELIPDGGCAPTRRRGRFIPTIGPGSLLDSVAEVALVAASGDPALAEAISKSAWTGPEGNRAGPTCLRPRRSANASGWRGRGLSSSL